MAEGEASNHQNSENSGGGFRKTQNFGDRPAFNRGRGGGRPFNNRGGGRPFNNRGGGRPFNNRGGGRPFNNRGGGRPFNNRGGGRPPFNNFNRDNSGGNFRNSEGRQGFNPRFNNKPWEQNNENFGANDNETKDRRNSASKHKKFDDDMETETNDAVNTENGVKDIKNTSEDGFENESETSESEDEVEMQTSNSKDNPETSESEEEIEVPVINKKDEFETSESDEEIAVPTINKKIESETSESEDEDLSPGIEEKESVEQNDSIIQETNEVNLSKNSKFSDEYSRKVLVKDFPVTIRDIHLQQFFSRYGKVVSVEVKRKPSFNDGRKFYCYAYILFEKREDALKALEVNGMEYKDHCLTIYMCGNSVLANESNSVIIKKLPRDMSYSLLWNSLESFGVIKSLYKSSNAGIATVNFDSTESADLAARIGKIVIEEQEYWIERFKEGLRKRTRPSMPAGPSMPAIKIQGNKHNSSFTITLNNGQHRGGSKFGHRVQSGYIAKRRRQF